jgi:hypothetical protein
MGKNLFAGIEGAEGDTKRLPYWGKERNGSQGEDDGEYIVELDVFSAFESTNEETEGRLTFVTECTIVEVVASNPGSPSVDEARSYIQIPDQKPGGGFTKKGLRKFGRVKAVAAAILNCEESQVTAAMCQGIAEGDGTQMAGIKLRVRVATKDSGWTDVYWNHVG